MSSSIDTFIDSIRAAGKILLLSRRIRPYQLERQDDRLFIMANGPSLAETLRQHHDLLRNNDTLAVNFAAISPEFKDIRPKYYVLADPHFFKAESEGNLALLRKELKELSWPATLFVPAPMVKLARDMYPGFCKVLPFNNVGIEGAKWICNAAFVGRRAMPRPRNVLIPSLMIAIWLGYKEIVVFGADHSWMQSLSVTDDNEVVSIQKHFYADDEAETTRVRHEYRNYRLHQIVESFAVAFKSYHDIMNFASHCGVKILNATPGSYIDAFERINDKNL